MLFTVRPCPLCLPQPLLWPRRPDSGHGSHVGGGGSGQGSSRRSGGGGTGVNTAGAGGGAGGGSGGAPNLRTRCSLSFSCSDTFSPQRGHWIHVTLGGVALDR